MTSIRPTKTIFLYRNGKIRRLYPYDFLINKNTPKGEPPHYYERKPYDGKRMLDGEEFLGQLIDDKFKIHSCTMTVDRWNAIINLNIPLSKELFHNGQVYTTYKEPFLTLQTVLKRREKKEKIRVSNA
jgi:hypothetical protein